MKKFLAVLVLATTIAAPAFAEECMVGKDAMVPVMKHNAKAHKVTQGRDGQSLVERAETSDGTKVTYAVGGCSHFAFEYKFENIKGGIPNEPDDPFTLPLKLMASVPFRDQFDAEMMVKALKAKQAEGKAVFDDAGKTSLPCGDAVCNLTITKDSVTIDYDFAI
jgi:hypothetical protein